MQHCRQDVPTGVPLASRRRETAGRWGRAPASGSPADWCP